MVMAIVIFVLFVVFVGAAVIVMVVVQVDADVVVVAFSLLLVLSRHCLFHSCLSLRCRYHSQRRCRWCCIRFVVATVIATLFFVVSAIISMKVIVILMDPFVPCHRHGSTSSSPSTSTEQDTSNTNLSRGRTE